VILLIRLYAEHDLCRRRAWAECHGAGTVPYAIRHVARRLKTAGGKLTLARGAACWASDVKSPKHPVSQFWRNARCAIASIAAAATEMQSHATLWMPPVEAYPISACRASSSFLEKIL
jgi:hypothetical protein